MASHAVSCAERATSDLLIGPDWGINMELCDIINMDPGQTKDVMQVLRKQLGSRNPEIQLLTLVVLETLSKNCGDSIFQQMVACDVLSDMVNLVNRKPDLRVREKILTLIDAWQEAFGGIRGKYPQYYGAYNQLRASGVSFPPREANSVPFFTPPQTQPTATRSISFEEPASFQAHLDSDASGFSLVELQNARGIADALLDMLRALDPKSPEGLRQELIVDLVAQCKSYQTRIMDFVSSTTDEQLLCQGLALNDNLQRAISLHDDIARGIHIAEPAAKPPSVPLIGVSHGNDDDDEVDEFAQLTRRSTRENGKNKNPVTAPTVEAPRIVRPFLPPPPPSKNPIVKHSDAVDYLSGDAFTYEVSSDANPPPSMNSSLPSNPPPSSSSKNSEPQPDFVGPPVFDEPRPESSHLNEQSGDHSLYDSLLDQTHNLSLDPSPSVPAKQEKVEEDAFFKDLVDLSKAKPKPDRSP